MQTVHGGNLADAAARYGRRPEEFIDFSASINPLGLSPRVTEALLANIASIVHYPDTACRLARRALAEWLGVDPSCIIVSNGAAELIHLVVGVLPPRRALLAAPSFSEYGAALAARGVALEWIRFDAADGFAFRTERWLERLAAADIVFIGNPNNPTGRSVPRDGLLAVVERAAAHGAMVVVDEAFLDFLPDAESRTLVHEAAGRDGVFVIRSLTKFFALPGLRIGCGVGIPGLVERLRRARDPWSVNTLAQVAAVAALGDREYIDRTRSLITEEREYLWQGLRKLPGLRPYPAEANFILIELTGNAPTAAELRDRLGREGVLIRDCADFPGLTPHFFRVAVRRRDENRRLLALLEQALVV